MLWAKPIRNFQYKLNRLFCKYRSLALEASLRIASRLINHLDIDSHNHNTGRRRPWKTAIDKKHC